MARAQAAYLDEITRRARAGGSRPRVHVSRRGRSRRQARVPPHARSCCRCRRPTTSRRACSCSRRWRAGVPVVQPRRGAFTEIVEQTGGGLLVRARQRGRARRRRSTVSGTIAVCARRWRSAGSTASRALHDRAIHRSVACGVRRRHRACLEARAGCPVPCCKSLTSRRIPVAPRRRCACCRTFRSALAPATRRP